jgi:hypothetical protein
MKLRRYIDEVVSEVLSNLGIDCNSDLFKHVHTLVIWWVVDERRKKGKNYVPSKWEIQARIKAILADVCEFYSDKKGYAEKRAKEEYRRIYGLSYGRYMFKIVDNGDDYKILLFNSLCEDPELFSHVTIYIPKVTEDELNRIRDFI